MPEMTPIPRALGAHRLISDHSGRCFILAQKSKDVCGRATELGVRVAETEPSQPFRNRHGFEQRSATLDSKIFTARARTEKYTPRSKRKEGPSVHNPCSSLRTSTPWSCWHTDTKPCVMLEMNVQDTGSLRMLGVPLSHAFVTARGLTRGLSNASRVPPFPFLIYVAKATARATATAMVTASASRARAWAMARAAAAASSRARAVSLLVLLSRVLRR